MTTTEIRETLHEVREAVEVPPVDRVAFQRRVRVERRRRTTGRVAVAGVAAAAVVAGVALVNGVGGPGSDRRLDQGAAGHSAVAASLPGTVFFVLDGRLTALDPAGVVHDLGVRSEGVIGWTSERVYAVDDDSHLVVRSISYDEEGSGRATFEPADSPVSGAVQTASLSGDGRYLGWTGLDDVSHRYDLKAGREDLTFPGDAQTGVVAVSADGLLLAGHGDLVLRDADSSVAVPVESSGYGVASDSADGRVLVNDRDDHVRLYDVRDGSARLVDALTGFGVLGPYAERVAVLSGDRSTLQVWDGGHLASPTGLRATPDQVRWADETTLLVAAHTEESSGLYACDIDLACRSLPVEGEVSLNQ